MFRVENPDRIAEVQFIRVAVPPTSHQRWGSSANPTGGSSSHLRGWRERLHWDVPPPFENRKQALMDLGLEGYKEAVREYYASIGDWRVENAQRLHSRWVVKRVLREFESRCRKFNRDRNGRLLGPEEIWADDRLMVDLEYHIRRYQVRGDLVPATKRLCRLTLAKLWRLPLSDSDVASNGTPEQVVNS